mgnify:CR=1 FL=1
MYDQVGARLLRVMLALSAGVTAAFLVLAWRGAGAQTHLVTGCLLATYAGIVTLASRVLHTRSPIVVAGATFSASAATVAAANHR